MDMQKKQTIMMIKLEHTLSIMTNANLRQTTMQTEQTFIQIHKQNR